MCHLWVALHQQTGLVVNNYRSLLNENQVSISFLDGELCALCISGFLFLYFIYKLTHLLRALFCVCISMTACVCTCTLYQYTLGGRTFLYCLHNRSVEGSLFHCWNDWKSGMERRLMGLSHIMNTEIVRVYTFSHLPCDNPRYSHETVTHLPGRSSISPQVSTFPYIPSICASLFQKHSPSSKSSRQTYTSCACNICVTWLLGNL